jgi:hypothetical protein
MSDNAAQTQDPEFHDRANAQLNLSDARWTDTDTGKIPLWLKIFVAAWAAVLVPSYAVDSGYGLLWLCNVGLILTVLGLCTENRLLVSMAAVGNVPWLLLWCVHMTAELAGVMLDRGVVDGPASYMFNSDYPLYARILSIYHGWLPFVLLFALKRLGYDRRAFFLETLLAWALILAAYIIVPNADTPAGNVNLVFGYTADRDPVLWVNRPLWIAIVMLASPLMLYLPMHLFYKRFFVPTTSSQPD